MIKKRYKSMIILFLIISFISITLYLYLSNNSIIKLSDFNNENIKISLVDNTVQFKILKLNTSTIFWNKPNKYIPLNESKSLNITNPIEKSYFTNVTNGKPSIYIEYDKEYMPDIIQVQILGSDNSYYYWDYILKSEPYLNFLLPSTLIDSSEVYSVQINCLWTKKNSNILVGNKQYNFNFKINTV